LGAAVGGLLVVPEVVGVTVCGASSVSLVGDGLFSGFVTGAISSISKTLGLVFFK